MKITTVTLDSNSLRWRHDIMPWCERTLGPGAVEDRDAWRDPCCNWSLWSSDFTGLTYIEFRHPEDAVQFKLTWG